jgi:hypothetical protein
VTCHQFGLVLGDFWELGFDGIRNTSVKRASTLAKEGAIGDILN